MGEPESLKLIDKVPDILRMCLSCQRQVIKLSKQKPRFPAKPKYETKRRSEWKDPYKADRSQIEGLCKCCKITKPKIFQGLKPYGDAIYSDNKKRSWRGTTCPDCIISNRQKALHKKDYQHSCKICSKSFLGHSAAKYCGTKCRKKAESIQNREQRIKRFGPPKPRPLGILKHCKIYHYDCPQCNSKFVASHKLQKYCSNRCQAKAQRLANPETYKKAKKNYKRVRNKRVKCKIAKHYRTEIISIYDNRGTREIDHIIPLNHPDVCGLHVPWNLEPITKRRNWNKSNKWDGTMENLTYRPWAKN